MVTKFGSTTTRRAALPVAHSATSSLRFDLVMIMLCMWMLTGLYIDGWAHNHGFIDNSFFTPWHGILYSGFFAIAGYLGAALIGNRIGGYSWFNALPKVYYPALLGVVLFTLGGFGDMLWHIAFGIERGVEPLLSPTHLLLASGGGLLVTAPLRSAWNRIGTPRSIAAWLPVHLSLLGLLSLLTFFTLYAHPVGMPVADGAAPARSMFFNSHTIGISGIIMQTVILFGLLLFVTRRWFLPPGSFTFIITLNTLGMAIVSIENKYVLVAAAIIAGVFIDLLYLLLKPAANRVAQLRLFALVAPVVQYSLYFITLMLTDSVWWTIHLWGGAIVISGIVGFMMSFLVFPPQIPSEEA